jgi:hypothetical protein
MEQLTKTRFLIGQPIYRTAEKFSTLWDDIHTQGWAAMLPAIGVAGTWVLQDLAKSIASKKTTFLNRPLNVRYGRVLMIRSGKHKNIVRSMFSVNTKQGFKPRASKFACPSVTETIKTIENSLGAYKTDAVMIDSLPGMFGISPGDAVKSQTAIKQLQKLAASYDTSVIFLCSHGVQANGGLPVNLKNLKKDLLTATRPFTALSFKKRNYSLG